MRAAVAAKLGLPLGQVEVITPDVGGGFGVKIVHPWPEEVLVPLGGDAARPAGEVDRGPARALHLLAPTSAASCSTIKVGFDDDGPAARRSTCSSGTTTAPTRRTASSCPIITSTQLLGPYKPGAYRVEFESLYTNTVIVTPYRGAGRPQGCFAMERTMDAIADDARPGPGRGARERNFIQPDEFPYDHGLIFQDGRPLIYDSGDYPALAGEAQGAGRLGRLRRRSGEQAAREGRQVGIGLGLLRRGHRRRALRGRARAGRDRPARSRSRPG